MKLRDVAISHRSTVLEENSFSFVEHHGLGPKSSFPPGFRSDWTRRNLLAVAKLADLIDVGPQRGGFQLLLQCSGKFETDQFMEVHILVPLISVQLNVSLGPFPKSRWMLRSGSG